MALLKANVRIVGERPILFNRFSVDSIPLGKKEKTGVAGNDPEEWKRSVMKTEERQLYVESSYIFGCLRDGGKHIKSGKGSIQAKLASTLTVPDNIVLIDRFVPLDDDLSHDNTQPVYLDVRSVKNPTTKSRNIRYRIAASKGWRATFEIEWENTIVSRGEMEEAVKSAGSFVGLGDGRTVGCGRFTVERFEIQEAKEIAKEVKKKSKK